MRLLLALCLCMPVAAATLPDPAIAQLGALFIEGSVEIQGFTCSARFPASREQWATSVKDWKSSNVAALEELRSLSNQLEASTERQAGAGQLVAFRAQAALVFLQALAATTDSQAEMLCTRFRAALIDDTANQKIFQQAKVAAAAFLANTAK